MALQQQQTQNNQQGSISYEELDSGLSTNNNSKFEYKNLTFPIDLGVNPDKQHYIGFYIRQVKNTKYKAHPSYNIQNDPSTSSGASIADYAHRLGDLTGQGTPGYVLSNQAIFLYMPHDVKTTYETEWDTIESPFRLEPNSETISKLLSERGMEFKSGLANTLLSALNISQESAKDLDLKLANVAINPHRERLFRGVAFRQFSYEFKLSPKSAAECKTIENIIKTFKFHMLPETATNDAGRWWLYPSEFNIVYYFGSEANGQKRNPWLHRIGNCSLTQVDVNYTSSGMWSAFRNGAPIEIDLNLSFTESEILSKERIMEGY